jgi:hypothetical protein
MWFRDHRNTSGRNTVELFRKNIEPKRIPAHPNPEDDCANAGTGTLRGAVTAISRKECDHSL